MENDNIPYKLIVPGDKNSKHYIVKIIDTRTIKIEKAIKYETYLGVDIDVFPLDGQPCNDIEYRRWYKKLSFFYKKALVCDLYYVRGKTIKNIALWIIKRFVKNKQKYLEKAKELHDKYPCTTSKYVGCIESAFNSVGNRFLKSYFEKSVLVDFEGYMFKAPRIS